MANVSLAHTQPLLSQRRLSCVAASHRHSHGCLQFVAAGGLQQLLEIFNSGILEPKEQESWTVVRIHNLNQL